MAKSECNHPAHRPTVKLSDAECLETARETRAVFAAKVVVAKEQLRREELRARLHLGLTVAGAYDHAEQFEDAPAACEQLRKEIRELEERCVAIDVAIDRFAAIDLQRKIAHLAPELETAHEDTRARFPDAEALVRTKNSLNTAGVALRSGVGLNFSQEQLLRVDEKTSKRIGEYEEAVGRTAELSTRIGSFAAGLDTIRQKYSPVADVIVPR